MVVDTGMRESLIEAGLVDPSGNFTSEPNFGGPPEADGTFGARPVDTGEAASNEGQEAPKTADQGQGAVTDPGATAADRGPGAGIGPTTPERLGNEADPIRQRYDTTVSELDRMAEMAFITGRTIVDAEGKRLYTDEQLATKIGQELQTAKQQAYLSGVMERMQPVAKRAAAEQIAQEHGVTVDDIINETSPLAMQTRARTIAELKREGKFQERKTNGTDQAEGSRGFSSAIPEAIERMSPQQKMYLGFARGDR